MIAISYPKKKEKPIAFPASFKTVYPVESPVRCLLGKRKGNVFPNLAVAIKKGKTISLIFLRVGP
jgi:hypothetical protein